MPADTTSLRKRAATAEASLDVGLIVSNLTRADRRFRGTVAFQDEQSATGMPIWLSGARASAAAR
jgi:hypothetical protein